MTSSDHEILISVNEILNDYIKQQNEFNAYVIQRFDSLDKRIDNLEVRVERIEHRLDSLETRTGKLETSTRDLSEEVHLLNLRVDDIQLYGGWLIGAITLMATLMTILIPALTAIFTRREPKSESAPSPAPAPVFYIRPADFVITKEDVKS